MAEPDIKDEPRSRAATETEPVINDQEQVQPAQLNINRLWDIEPTPEPPAGPIWRDCAHLDLLQQIEIKEQAVRDAISCVRAIERSLERYAPKVTSSQKWLERMKSIEDSKRECRVLIGFLGASGAGKSSLINALLEQDDLLPADDEKACTAVCVEIFYNRSEDLDSAFVAKVHRISEDDWRVELEKLFQDLSDQVLNKDGEDGEPDLERDIRIKAAFQKLRCVYPHIKSTKDLKSITIPNLLAHPNVKGILGKSKTIIDSTRDGFASKIKPFIDSSNSKEEGGKSFAQWPLVKLVRIQIKSNILKDGIVLVDLPGSMDTNVARGAIAENFQKNLSVTCVVAPTQRAVSDKPAQDLLGRVTQRTLQLDNHFSSDKLCFIVSKTDSSLNVPRYIKTHPNVEQLLASNFENEARFNERLARAKDYCTERREIQAKNKAILDEVSKELKGYSGIPKNLKVGRPKKRKIDDADEAPENNQAPTAEEKANQRKARNAMKKRKQAKTNFDVAGNELYKGQEKIRQLEDALKAVQSRQTAACIRNRNETSAIELRNDYHNASKQLGHKNKKTLQVFGVSALAFSDMMKGAISVPGFLKISDTGIPVLQRWLVETTLADRERNAVNFLEDVVSLELSMGPWISDTSAEYKLPEEQRQNVEDAFDNNYNTLRKGFTEINTKIVQVCATLVDTGLSSKMDKTEITAAAEVERIVKSWAQKPMHWSTHRALNRGNGEWKTHKGVKYDWNEDLTGNFLEPLVAQWARVIHSRLPALRRTYDSDISSLVQEFVTSVSTKIMGVCPEMAEAIGQWKESILRTPTQIHKHSGTIFDETIQDAAREAHRTVKPEVLKAWAPTYDQCGKEVGPGHFKRNQLTHVAQANKLSSRKMYHKGTKAVQTAFQKLWDSLPKEFGEATDPASKQVHEEFETMLQNHTLNEETSEQNQRQAKIQLQQEVQSAFDKLKTAWGTKIHVTQEAEEVDPKLEDVDIDDLFNPDVDSDMFSSSDSEDDELAES
ncbi:Nuclear GTPase SLIP-GC [Lachnellula suecica]|uniref:Nuclear GTPase SLIP-GC n=1 Tax=Lachnellula suecica TaxID=602035 RepID=A0A8T9C433_9HELO|nr:Nuclear GTPase SLIP-GC [Lachnellula suecica]